MENQGIVEFFNDRLQLGITMPPPRRFMQKWKDLAERWVIYEEMVMSVVKRKIIISLGKNIVNMFIYFASFAHRYRHNFSLNS